MQEEEFEDTKGGNQNPQSSGQRPVKLCSSKFKF
jgi:hypothetical protein